VSLKPDRNPLLCLAAFNFIKLNFTAKEFEIELYLNQSLTSLYLHYPSAPSSLFLRINSPTMLNELENSLDSGIYINYISGGLWRNLVQPTGEFKFGMTSASTLLRVPSPSIYVTFCFCIAGPKGYPTPRLTTKRDIVSFNAVIFFIFVFQFVLPVFLTVRCADCLHYVPNTVVNGIYSNWPMKKRRISQRL
jgi:hypothetical protein